jgi:4-amino-4-deoxy-L-arabinose transferase-like glycosyltransferase
MKIEPAFLADSRLSPRWAMLLWLALFAGGILCMLPNFHAYYTGDEHFYTDGAIRMEQTGQFLTPTYADGDLRFNKPVLTYWLILSSFRLFGISVLSSRLLSLVAGLGILLLTRRLAIRLFKTESAGWLAMLVMASNIDLMAASMRATPDIFLCLFALLSLYGFAGRLLGEPQPADAWLAYVGAGLAVASKGMLGVLLMVFVFLFALSRRDRGVRLRALWCPLPIFVCLALALSWYVAVYWVYGDLALHGFLNDQVGNRVSSSAGTVLSNLFHYTIGLLQPFLPWSLLLLAGLVVARSVLAQTRREHAAAFAFVFAWYLLMVIVFSPANITRTRYFLPAFPLLAAGFAALLPGLLGHPTVARLARRMLQGIAVGLLPLGAGVLFMALTLDVPRLYAAAALFFMLAAVVAVGVRRGGVARQPVLLALTAFAILWDFHFLVRAAFPTTPSYALVRTLQQAGARHVYWVSPTADMPPDKLDWYKETYDSQILLISGGAIEVERMPLPDYLKQASRAPMICYNEDVRLFPEDRYQVIRSGIQCRTDIGRDAIAGVILAPDRKAAFRALFVPFYVVFLQPGSSK